MPISAQKSINAKYRTYGAAAGWLVLCLAMFFYGFGVLDASNQATQSKIDDQKSILTALQAERDSYVKAQADIAQMNAEAIQPSDFFNKDITLVNEIKTLEDWSNRLGVQLSIAGLSGTIKTAAQAPTLTPILVLPYSITLTGSLPQVVNFIEVLENLGFITNVSGVSFTAASSNTVNASLAARFYLKQ